MQRWIDENVQIGHFDRLPALGIAVLVVITLIVVAQALRSRALQRFADGHLLHKLLPQTSVWRRISRNILTILALSALALALLDIRVFRTTQEMSQRGIDIVFAVDVSRSMLAADVSPSRLERAKQLVRDVTDVLEGDRVGLVVFAGTAKLHSPLTTNYNDFRNSLREIGPHDVPRGGSNLTTALETAGHSFLDKTNDHKAVIMLTDGEDQDSNPAATAKELFEERGVRIFTMGLGDSLDGARVPRLRRGTGPRWMEYNGQQVWSKLNESSLHEIAAAANGAYIPVGTKQIPNMGDICDQYIRRIATTELQTSRIQNYIPRFQWFAGFALLCLLLDACIADGRRALKTPTATPTTQPQVAIPVRPAPEALA